jgi:cytochrome P450
MAERKQKEKQMSATLPVNDRQNRVSRAALANGPAGLPLVGSTLEVMADPVGFLLRMAHEYGSLARYRLGSMTMNQVNHPAGVQRVLLDNKHNYDKGDNWEAMRQVAGNGLLTSEGSYWLSQRRLMQPAFHRQRIAGFAGIMLRRTQEMLARWQVAAGSGTPIDISQEFSALTMAIIMDTMFSSRIQAHTQQVSRAIAFLLEDINFRFIVPFYPKMNVPTLRNLRARRALGVLDRVIFQIIQERRSSGEQLDDLLGMLMEAKDEETGEAMTDRQLRDEVITIFVAGHETTAVLLAWLFHALAQHAAVQEQLYAEVDQVLNGRLPGLADLPTMPYLRMVIDETLRLYPPAWITNRECREEDELCGYRIPAGEVVSISPYVMHRLPEYWDTPERFDPQRFNPQQADERPRFTYLPFGAGPRQCIGNNFALLEAQLIIASLAQQVRLTPIPGKVVTLNPVVTLRAKNGIWMKVQRR